MARGTPFIEVVSANLRPSVINFIVKVGRPENVERKSITQSLFWEWNKGRSVILYTEIQPSSSIIDRRIGFMEVDYC